MLIENNKQGRFAVMAVGTAFIVVGFIGDKPTANKILTLLVGAMFFVAAIYANATSYEGSIVLDEDEHKDHDQKE
jgi:hypothetical protein